MFGPGQFALQLLLLVEERLVLSAQRREARGKLIGKLRYILLRLIAHGCVSAEQSGGVAVTLAEEERRMSRQIFASSTAKKHPKTGKTATLASEVLDTASALRLSFLS